MTSPRSSHPHPVRFELPQELHTKSIPMREPGSPLRQGGGSAILSASESDTEGDARYGSMEDASILYSKPQKRPATRTLSMVSNSCSSLQLFLFVN
jgi:hypothetical protein